MLLTSAATKAIASRPATTARTITATRRRRWSGGTVVAPGAVYVHAGEARSAGRSRRLDNGSGVAVVRVDCDGVGSSTSLSTTVASSTTCAGGASISGRSGVAGAPGAAAIAGSSGTAGSSGSSDSGSGTTITSGGENRGLGGAITGPRPMSRPTVLPSEVMTSDGSSRASAPTAVTPRGHTRMTFAEGRTSRIMPTALASIPSSTTTTSGRWITNRCASSSVDVASATTS